MRSIVDYLTALSKREQILIGIMVGLLLVVVGYYGITRPLFGAIAAAKQDQVEAVLREGRIMAKLDALTADGTQLRRADGVEGTLDLFARGSLSELGLSPTEVTAMGDTRLRLTITPVSAPTLFGWLANMESRGLVVSELDVKPAEGSTLAAQVTLERR
jgi:general secretion pathway protein M